MRVLTPTLLPIFDGHNDLLLRLWFEQSQDPVADFFHGLSGGHLDYPRMKQGGFAGGLFAVFIPPARYVAPKLGISLQQAEHLCDPLMVTHAQLALAHQLEAQSQGRIKICRSVADITYCLQHDVIAMVLHIEGAGALDAHFSQLDAFYQAGVRSIGPFWNDPNLFGEGVTGAFPGSPDSGNGLTAAGKALVRACREHHILVDVSHMNEKAFWDTVEIGGGPLVATHSNSHALCPQPRNLTDKQLWAIKHSNGLVGVNFGTAFLRADGKRDGNTPLETIMQHIDYLTDILGEDRLAFGSDFDGISLPDEMKDVAGLPGLIRLLIDAGYDQLRLEKLCWRNWLRVLGDIWQAP